MINVVGSGLAGSLVTRLLRRAGAQVRVIDDRDKFSASEASSNLFIDHWLKKFNSEKAQNGVRVLREFFSGDIDQPFAQGLGYAMKVNHIPQRSVLVKPDILGNALSVDRDGVVYLDEELKKVYFLPGKTVVCAGYRTPALIPDVKMDIKVGHAFFFEGNLPEGKSRVALISPFKHEKLYQFNKDVIYYADSVAVKLSTYKKRGEELKQRTYDRVCTNHFSGLPTVLDFKVGYRPITPGYDFGRLDNPVRNVWSITGGGKNGLVAYADLADKLVRKIA